MAGDIVLASDNSGEDKDEVFACPVEPDMEELSTLRPNLALLDRARTIGLGAGMILGALLPTASMRGASFSVSFSLAGRLPSMGSSTRLSVDEN